MTEAKKELKTLNAAEVALVHGGAGEINGKYLTLRSENTKSINRYTQLASGGSKSTR